ncbi:hypothetical protein BN159_1081 [Streptomyces davaonensis JCM 4913]|uniref:Uncharacterized protein n=1 Tax=Streptomyces davaonensis (strain DSM 101723 / JCM 4913 / KCC S-0913 / 768) TaxID=1214101 RepID=K4QXA4_STRDJ|nr:hypothetical protein [Streptomyces davaonensis]CCK25460.1 hypothetical protein BN159_1081 [Streptomyces davaonensis JCM 4913]
MSQDVRLDLPFDTPVSDRPEYLKPSAQLGPAEAANALARLFVKHIKRRTEEHRISQDAAQQRLDELISPHPGATLHVEGALQLVSPAFLPPDEEGHARLRRLDASLRMIEEAFPEVGTDIEVCRLSCMMLEGAWRSRALTPPREDEQTADCACSLCRALPTAPARTLDDYRWRQSAGRPLTVKTWPYRDELDSVLTGGWSVVRQMNDLERDLGYRHRFEDDILLFHEYKRVIDTIDTTHLTQLVEGRLAESFSINTARALVCGLYAAHKRSADEYWLQQHTAGNVVLPQTNPLTQSTYSLLQMMDCLFWHVSPDSELWQEEHLASLLLCRVVDDMTDVRVDALTGEISNFWLADMPAHTKALYAASAIALIKYGCLPEARSSMWNTWLMPSTIVWMGLTGRHALWFDGITQGLPSAEECPLCDLQPNACTGILTDGTTLTIAPRPTVSALSPRTAELSARCRVQFPETWPLFDAELHAFEALHGPWHGDTDSMWEVLRRTYIAAVEASRAAASKDRAREVQEDSGVVGAEFFHALYDPQTGREDTAILAYMFGCAHPHFLWNAAGHRPSDLRGDWLDG